MSRQKGKSQIGIYIDDKIFEWIEEKAKKERRPKSKVATNIIEDAYEKEKGGE